MVQTDSKDCPKLIYALRATIYPEWEIRGSEGSSRTVPVGQAGHQVMQIICRRVAGEGRILPARVEAESPVTVRFLGEPRERKDSEGITSSSRDVEVSLPPMSQPGSHHGDIRFRWSDGRTQGWGIYWEVVPWLRASPSRLVVKPSEIDVPLKISIRASDRPFRVTGIGPSHLVATSQFSREASNLHIIELRLHPDRVSGETEPRITIHTDHPDQSTLSLGVYVLPTGV